MWTGSKLSHTHSLLLTDDWHLVNNGKIHKNVFNNRFLRHWEKSNEIHFNLKSIKKRQLLTRRKALKKYQKFLMKNNKQILTFKTKICNILWKVFFTRIWSTYWIEIKDWKSFNLWCIQTKNQKLIEKLKTILWNTY